MTWNILSNKPLMYLVCLLGGWTMFLGVLVGFEQQVDQTGDRSSVPQRGLVLWAQGQVADQADHSLQAGRRGKHTVTILFTVAGQQVKQGWQTASSFSIRNMKWYFCPLKRVLVKQTVPAVMGISCSYRLSATSAVPSVHLSTTPRFPPQSFSLEQNLTAFVSLSLTRVSLDHLFLV